MSGLNDAIDAERKRLAAAEQRASFEKRFLDARCRLWVVKPAAVEYTELLMEFAQHPRSHTPKLPVERRTVWHVSHNEVDYWVEPSEITVHRKRDFHYELSRKHIKEQIALDKAAREAASTLRRTMGSPNVSVWSFYYSDWDDTVTFLFDQSGRVAWPHKQVTSYVPLPVINFKNLLVKALL